MKRIPIIETIKYLKKEVLLNGWVNSKRKHGKIVFIDLRDSSGILQIVFDSQNEKAYQLAKALKEESVVEIKGIVRKRPKGLENPKLKLGKIELEGKEIKVLSEAKILPFPIDTLGYEISEEKRLKYRYLDLRRERLQRNLKIRSELFNFLRNFLKEKGFIEIETPLLTKSTPEGARDFLVPSRLYPGKFYALPQSPQQYKQLLMVAGIEKYFQIAKCLRDEDPRADRQPEFTQLDIEIAFAKENDVLELVEQLIIKACKKIFPEKQILKIPFQRISYKEALKKYRTDRPDLRPDKKNNNLLAFCFVVDFPMFEWSKSEKKWKACHHPFTKPKISSIEKLKRNPKEILAFQYDLVLNGFEIGGGSERTTDLKILEAVFEVLGHKPKEIREKFANYFEAFSYGVPPHAGVAIGLDRLLQAILAEKSIREVIAFPKTGDGQDLMMGVPANVKKEQLKELHIKISK